MKPSPDRCPCAGVTLDKLVQPAILAILAEGPLHGYGIVRKLSALRIAKGRRPDMTGVYRSLRSMQARGLVASAWDTSSPGPAKREFQLTAAGRKCLIQWAKTLEDYRGSIAQLLDVLGVVIRCSASPRACGCGRKVRGGRAAIGGKR